jgi:hypothetical protein
MLNRTILAAIIAGSTLLGPVASFAAASSPAPSPCEFQKHHVVSVTPYRVEERRIKTTSTRLAGADVYVEAEPGLTAEWLQLELTRHLAQMHDPTSMKDCALDVGAVKLEVASAGAGFWVRIVAADPKQADEVLRRARLLVG